ncbi:Endonuclease/exonuclease/phosphatase [Tribonema minus]|uniref:Endonuclease/exonuclease/phosphatase n=1 Tax=Tribonema minus TaxID=303371 RepID=A0A835YV26_9STRA|nr:Endonuclease/exonuclease/phosphatase [Tribonema minus]
MDLEDLRDSDIYRFVYDFYERDDEDDCIFDDHYSTQWINSLIKRKTAAWAEKVNKQIPALFAPENITLQMRDADGVERDVFVVVSAKSGPAKLTSMHTAEELAAQCDRCATGKLRHFMEDFVVVKLFIKTRAVEQACARYADLSGQPRATIISVLAAEQLSEHEADLAMQKSRLFRLVLSNPGGSATLIGALMPRKKLGGWLDESLSSSEGEAGSGQPPIARPRTPKTPPRAVAAAQARHVVADVEVVDLADSPVMQPWVSLDAPASKPAAAAASAGPDAAGRVVRENHSSNADRSSAAHTPPPERAALSAPPLCRAAAADSGSGSASGAQTAAAAAAPLRLTPRARTFRLVSWNTDGLSADTAVERAHEIACQVVELAPLPDAVMLQRHLKVGKLTYQAEVEPGRGGGGACARERECVSCVAQQLAPPSDAVLVREVTYETLHVFLSRLRANGYGAAPDECPPPDAYGRVSAYFTLTMICAETVRGAGGFRRAYTGSYMGRDLLCTTGLFHGTPLRLFNTHLESGRESAGERRAQLSHALTAMMEGEERGEGEWEGEGDEPLAILAGDMNLRDTEAKQEPLLKGVCDAWAAACGPKDRANKYTWDTLLNDNVTLDGHKIRMRMDRAYLNARAASGLRDFHLLGKERTLEGYFPSDHFGMCVTFEFQG